MGLDQIFYQTKRKRNYKNGNLIDAVNLWCDKEQNNNNTIDILWLRKEYDIQEIIYKLYGGPYGDALIIDHKTFKKIIKEYKKLIYKEDDMGNKSYMIMIERQLELIDKLFNFKKFCLVYEAVG